MNKAIYIFKRFKSRILKKFAEYFFIYPKNKGCNICGWSGRRFLNDQWHENVICPKCFSSVRHRLFKAAIDEFYKKDLYALISNKNILHCAPDKCLKKFLKINSKTYTTGDLLREDCELVIDLCDMKNISNNSFDLIIVFDILEHVESVGNALSEINRVLTKNGHVVFTVPQKDGLKNTIEGNSQLSKKDREIKFGQWDHRRIFGSDFSDMVTNYKFMVTAISEENFSLEKVVFNGLKPFKKSLNPLATNERRIYFCKKIN